MVISPIVFLVVVTGIAKAGDMKAVGRVGVKALAYFVVVSTIALIFGMAMAYIFNPGSGLNIDPSSLDSSVLDEKTSAEKPGGFAEFLLGMLPVSVIGAFAENEILQILVFSVLFGLGIVAVGQEKCAQLIAFFDTVLSIFFKIMNWIMRISPLGAFGAIAFIIGQYGIETIGTYVKLIIACYVSAVLFILLLGGIARCGGGVSLWKFFRFTKDEYLLALGTASTEAVMPRMMDKLNRAGCSRTTTGLVFPTGYSFNMDGSAIYLSISLVFMTQAFGVDLSLSQQITALAVLLLTSKGMAGVPGSAFLALSATSAALGLFPVSGVALMLGADRLMDSMRVVVNLTGNCVATFVVDRWEGKLNLNQAHAVLGSRETGKDTSVPFRESDDDQGITQELEKILSDSKKESKV
ncbi:C4-dicarboxylate transporter DctA [Rothia aerolata]|uniref:C4-dicarboxylate transporter DctA n=2 Tax=Rothia aerolata TaxID=1812262 RepID=A0A917MV82_9MICC|nr:C4-dicarboxylate transporter DctA [Rothia aerolata]